MTTQPAPRRPVRTRRSLRLAATASVALALVGGLAACGEDDDTGASADDTGSPVTLAAASLDPAACDAATALSAAFGGLPEDPAAVGPHVEAELLPLVEVLAAQDVEEVRTAGTTLVEAFSAAAGTGDLSGLDTPEVADAQAAVGLAVHDGCDLEQVEVTAVEYAFEGAPERLEAGRVSFALENAGVEDHEMVLFRRADGVTETFAELAELPEEDLGAKVSFAGVAFGGPGETTYAAVDLTPGTYFLVCFIPTGGGEDGPPHFLEGMQHTLEVS